MNTRSPISFISYNSESFLVMKLNELYEKKAISDFMWIFHKKEEDENKDHLNVWLNPNSQIDTVDLKLMFNEFDPAHPDKPLGITDPRKSNIDEWILYHQHFKPYLKSKLEDRKYYYQKEDFHFLDENTFEYNYYHAFHSSDWSKQQQINTLMQDPGFCKSDLIYNGVLPLQASTSLLSLLRLEQASANGITDRHGRCDTHD